MTIYIYIIQLLIKKYLVIHIFNQVILTFNQIILTFNQIQIKIIINIQINI